MSDLPTDIVWTAIVSVAFVIGLLVGISGNHAALEDKYLRGWRAGYRSGCCSRTPANRWED